MTWTPVSTQNVFLDDAGVRLTPRGIEAGTNQEDAAWASIIGTDRRKLRLEPGKTYHIEAECDILSKPNNSLLFTVRTFTGGWEHHDKGAQLYDAEQGGTWRISKTVTLDRFDDYAVEWHLVGAGRIRVRSLSIKLLNESYLIRDFEGGSVFLNSSSRSLQVKLTQPMRRLTDSAAPRHVIEVDDESPAFRCSGAWERRSGEEHYYGSSYRVAAKPGDSATWAFTVPADDSYTVFACAPGGKGLTRTAAYSMKAGSVVLHQAMDQTGCDGGWVKLFSAELKKGQRCEVVLRSGGTGGTAADAIRVESASRYNDGAVVRSVDLAPLDGVILLKQ